MHKITLSIIILNYNTKQLTLDSIASIEKNYADEVKSDKFELIVVDNASADGSVAAFQNYKKMSNIKTFHIVANANNLGFSKGNNKGVSLAKGTYVLFLNPDTLVYQKALTVMLDFMSEHPEVGAASCKLLNQDGAFDFNCHRGFPTPWNAFCYFSGLQRLFPRSRLFAGYTQGWKNLTTNHEVDAIEGAFMLIPKTVGEKVGWFDEEYFFYGEDLQMCYDIKKLGYKIFYLGTVKIMHIGGAASGIKKKTKNMTIASDENKRKVQLARFEAMRIFYRKNYKNFYPAFLQNLVFKAITIKEKKTLSD